MTMFYAEAVAVLAIATGFAHFTLGERLILQPLFAEPQSGVMKSSTAKAIVRAVWHGPSLAWGAIGIAVRAARLSDGVAFVSIGAFAVFAISGVANLAALCQPHIGGLMLLAIAGLTCADWIDHLP